MKNSNQFNSFRNSRLLRFTAIVMALLIFYLGCSPETVNHGRACSPIGVAITYPENVANNLELMLNYARTIDYQDGIQTHEQLFSEVFPDTEDSRQFMQIFKEESDDFQTLGFESYLDKQDNFSIALKQYLMSYSKDLESFLNESNPDLSEFSKFTSAQKLETQQSSLCDNDKKLMSFYLDYTQGYAQYYYDHYYSSDESMADFIQTRSCTFWTGLLCGILALVVGVVVFVVTYTFISIASVVEVNDEELPPGEARDDFGILLGIALGLWAGVNIYKWCCGRDEVPEQACLPPENFAIKQLGCNEFEYRIFGPSTYGPTEWFNINTDPKNIITDFPKLRFSIPSVGEASIFKADVTCLSDGTTLDVFIWDESITIQSDFDFFPLQWTVSPPESFEYVSGTPGFENIISASVNTPNNDIMSYQWNVNPPHQIFGNSNSSNNSIEILVSPNSNFLNLNVEATNTCLNISESIGATTFLIH